MTAKESAEKPSPTGENPTRTALDSAIAAARAQLQREQQTNGHWCYELEADCTIPAEYILMNHFTGEVDPPTDQAIAIYLRRRQQQDGSWPLFPGGAGNISASVKAYYALKLAGNAPEASHMRKARTAILKMGGAERSNVFTRITLALFQQVPWRATPYIPDWAIYLHHLPWSPFTIYKVAYWSRTVMVPLFVLCTLRPTAQNPNKIGIAELFNTPPEEIRDYFPTRSGWARFFLGVDYVLRKLVEPLIRPILGDRAVKKCKQWFLEHMNGNHGIGGIFPAMVNVLECLSIMGHPPDDPLRQQAREAIERLLVRHDKEIYCQPCVSPVWDTCLAAQAMIEAEADAHCLHDALDWLRERQLEDEPGDWRRCRPQLRGGGWAFQYDNHHYPDLDDTAMVAWAMYRHDKQRYQENIERAAQWLVGMQSKNGGFASFELDNTQHYLNHIPFADHGALLDPPTEDVTARIVALLGLLDKLAYRPAQKRAIAFLKQTQMPTGAWYGRWGSNYVYGTWSVLSALECAGEDPQQDWIQRAVHWLYERQNADGGWGESNQSYYPQNEYSPCRSTIHQTAWALLALLAAGEREANGILAGVRFLLEHQEEDGLWSEHSFNAPGFPRVFYLKYHGYARYFPLWALARYRNQSCRKP
ncbi:MAG: squalene--hopene cyclase [Candidatus Eutrophobiaceae bacterium]